MAINSSILPRMHNTNCLCDNTLAVDVHLPACNIRVSLLIPPVTEKQTNMKRTKNLVYYTRGASKDAWDSFSRAFILFLVNATFVMEDIFINFNKLVNCIIAMHPI